MVVFFLFIRSMIILLLWIFMYDFMWVLLVSFVFISLIVGKGVMYVGVWFFIDLFIFVNLVGIFYFTFVFLSIFMC